MEVGKSNRIVIIGAGVSGLVAARWLLEYDPSADIVFLEYHSRVGGVWDVEREYGVMETTVCNVSRFVMELNGLSWSKGGPNFPNFPVQTQVLEYIEKYANNFKLFEKTKITLNTLVTSVARLTNEEFNWEIHGKDMIGGTVKTFFATHLIVSSGHNEFPNYPQNIQGLEEAKNTIHSGNFKSCVKNDLFDTSVLVVGLSFSAVDAAVELKKGRNDVTVVLRNGCWFGERYSSCGKPSDLMVSRLFLYLPTWLINSILKLKFNRGLNQNTWQISNNVEPIGGKFVESSKFVDLVKRGKVSIRHGSLISIIGKEVTFEDGSTKEFDKIIFCTGYKLEFPFLEDSVNQSILENGSVNLYKNILHPDYEDTLTFVGLFNTRFTSPWPMIDMQARYIASLINKRTALPSIHEMLDGIAKQHQHTKDLGAAHRASLFMSPSYRDDLAKMIGCYPCIWFLTSPRRWIQHHFGPVTWAGYSLVKGNPGYCEKGEGAVDEICELAWGKNWFYKKLVGPLIIISVGLIVLVPFITWAV